jgi:hypothetical protein
MTEVLRPFWFKIPFFAGSSKAFYTLGAVFSSILSGCVELYSV